MVLPDKYPRSHYARKARHYAWALRGLFGVLIDQTTESRWSDLIALGRGLDTYIDEGDGDLFVRTAKAKQFLDEPDEVGAQFPALDITHLGEDTYRRLRQLGAAILRLNLEFKTTSAFEEYARLRKEEGRLYACLISSVATPAVVNQPGYATFCHLLEPTGEITNLINSLHGIRQDYARGEIAFRPSTKTHLQLLGHIALEVAQAGQITYSTYAMRHIASK